MITKIGQKWLQERLFSNKQPVLDKLVFGSGNTPPTFDDEKLENKQIEIIPLLDINNQNKLIAIAEMSTLQLENIHEIGLQADNLLISRDLFNLEIDPSLSKIKIKYVINLNTI